MNSHRIILGMVWAVVLALEVQAGSLRLIRQISLKEHVREPAGLLGAPTHHVRMISFSPDEKRLAIVAGDHWLHENDPRTHVLIVSTENIAVGFEDLVPGVEYFRKRLIWSPDSQKLLLPGKGSLLTLDGELAGTCQQQSWKSAMELGTGDEGGFLKNDEFAIAFLIPPPRHLPNRVRYRMEGDTRLITFDTMCEPKHAWTINGHPLAMDANPETGFAVVSMMWSGLVLFDTRNGKEVQRWEKEGFEHVQFFDNGKGICRTAEPKVDARPQCWELSSRGVTQKEAPVRSGTPFSTSSRGTLIAFTNATYRYNPFTHFGADGVKDHVLWDYSTGKIVVRWKPSMQKVEHNLELAESEVPWVFSLSSTGKYLAEGGAGIVKIYEVLR